jgi:RNA polymerase sigma-70 factor (sigma-E family)
VIEIGRLERDDDFADFVVARYSSLVRIGYLLTGDRGHAEDLVQVALMRTFRAWERLGKGGSPEAYTRTVMIRLATRWGRRQWHRERPTQTLPETAACDPAADVATRDMVHRALAALPLGQRVVLVLRYFEDLSEVETAALVGCSLGTVKSRAHRGLSALRATGILASSTDAREVNHG